MLVRTVMSKPVLYISPVAQVGQALEYMKANNIKHLPVLHDSTEELIGLVSENDLLKVFPKKDLNQFQLNLLSRTMVNQVMETSPVVMDPDETLENAALIMRNCNIQCIPVLEQGKLVGILCEDDLTETFMMALGIGQPGIRVTVKLDRRQGFLTNLISTLDEMNIIVTKLVYLNNEILLKVDSTNKALIEETLQARGFKVLHITEYTTATSCPLPARNIEPTV